MATYYFTYGIGEDTDQAYQGGGWTEVEAPDAMTAIKAYKVFHPVTKDGLLPCCGVAYTHEQMTREYKFFPGQNMLKNGNGGKFCRDKITISREVM